MAKILPRTRNEAASKCGSSVVSGNDNANFLASPSLTRTTVLAGWQPTIGGGRRRCLTGVQFDRILHLR